MGEKKLHKLCCYLYKEKYQDIERVLLKEKMFKEEQYKQITTIDDIPKERISGYLKKITRINQLGLIVSENCLL